jgi:hypothetical protein
MKFLPVVFLFAFVMPAYATYTSLSCSNATGSVMWEEGQNSNMARLSYDGFVSGVLDIEIAKITMEMSNQLNLRERVLTQCGAQSTLMTFAARVVITPAADYPDALLSYFPENRITADVICEKIVSNRSDCRP